MTLSQLPHVRLCPPLLRYSIIRVFGIFFSLFASISPNLHSHFPVMFYRLLLFQVPKIPGRQEPWRETNLMKPSLMNTPGHPAIGRKRYPWGQCHTSNAWYSQTWYILAKRKNCYRACTINKNFTQNVGGLGHPGTCLRWVKPLRIAGQPYVKARWSFGSRFLDLLSSISDRLPWAFRANVSHGQPCVCAFCIRHEIGGVRQRAGKDWSEMFSLLWLLIG